ncbi:MAG: hypothetical protein ISP75_04065 [Cryomorphaceae bacterium]|nr:hypothetical protein [Cryomorphaceae bacterium]MBL6867796.1 hypothetical protein [Cryomorphaceae bacterium]
MKLVKFSALLLVAIVFTQCGKDAAPVSAPTMLPVDAPLIVRINDAEKFTAFSDSVSLPYVQAIDVAILNKYSNGPWTGALVASGADKFDWIWTFKDTLGQGGSMTENETIYSIDSLYGFKVGSTWTISKKSALLQDLLNQRANGFSLAKDAQFTSLWNSASKADVMNLFIQHKEIEALGGQFFKQDWSWMTHIAAWSEIDLALRKNKLIGTSVSLCPDSAQVFLNTFTGSVRSATLSAFVASSSTYALGMKTDRMDVWLRSFNSYRSQKQRLKPAQRITTEANVDPILFSTTNLTGDFIRVGYGDATICLLPLKTGGSKEVGALLTELSSTTATVDARTSGTLKEKHKFLFSALYGWFFSDLGTPSWTINDEVLAIAPNAQILEVYMSEIGLGKTWDAMEAFDPLSEALNKADHLTFATSLKGFTETAFCPSEQWPGNFNNALLVGSVEVKEALAFGSLTVQSQKEQAISSSYLWSTPLEAPVIAGPFLVKNHRSGVNNVVVQDETNTLYWLNEVGEVQWTKKLDHPVIGPIEQVDLFKNAKYQLVFTTSNQLHCIDLLGRNVEAFPIALPSTTTLGLTVVDYDKNRNYRFLVPCGDRLYNFTSDGKRVEGWKTDASNGTLTQRPFLYQRGGKDYIITSTLEQAFILNRRGESRIKTNALPATANPWALSPSDLPSILRAGDDGELQEQRWDGAVEILEHDVKDLIGLEQQSYGRIYWSNESVTVQSGSNRYNLAIDNRRISSVETYPGGTGVIYCDDNTIHVTLLNEPISSVTQFDGTYAKAGRLTTTGPAVLVIAQGNAVIAYQL